MVDSEQDQKTEDPTAKRIDEARGEGQLPISRELAAWGMFVAAYLVIGWLGPYMADKSRQPLSVFLDRPEQISLEGGGLQDVLMGVLLSVALPVVAVFGLFLTAAVLGTMVQTSFYVNPGRIKFDPSKLLTLGGLKQLFSPQSLVELAKSFAKMVVLGYMAWLVIGPVFGELKQMVDTDLLLTMDYLRDKTVYLIMRLMFLITIIAAIDAWWVHFSYKKSLRMTKQEVKDENKQMEGDPMVKGRLRSIRLEKARRRMMANLPKADVVITNPTHFAVALQYDRGKMMAPVVIAKGADSIAARIREKAEELEIPLVSNPPLARALYDTVDVDEPIKPEQYKAVAEVISYVYKLKKKVFTR